MDNIGKVGIELVANTSAFLKDVNRSMNYAKSVASKTMQQVKASTSSAFSGKEVVSYTKQIDYLQMKLDDIRQTIQMGSEKKGLFHASEIREMEVEAEQLQNQIIRLKGAMNQIPSFGDNFKGIGEGIRSAFDTGKATEMTSKLHEVGQAGMSALQKMSSSGDGLSSKMASSVLPAISKIAPAFSRAIPVVGQAVTVVQGLSSAVSSARSAFSQLSSGVKTAMNKVISGFKSAIEWAKKFTGQSTNVDKSWTNSLMKIGALIGSVFGVHQLYQFGKEAVSVAQQMQASWSGLYSIVNATGGSFSNAKGFLQDYVKDGLIPLSDAVTAYKNLMMAGYTEEQAESMLQNLKDASAFGRRADLTMGQAVATATEGIRNENSILVDNSGVTKNLSIMHEEYAKSIGKTVSQLTKAERQMAVYQGLQRETAFQTGDASVYADTYAGKIAKVTTAFTYLKEAVGKVVAPIIGLFLPSIERAINALTNLFNKIRSVMAVFGLEFKEYVTKSATSAVDSMADSTSALSSGLDNAGSTATSTAKKIKKAFAGVDEINVLNMGSDGSSGGTGGSSGDGSSGGLGGSMTNPLEEMQDTLTQNDSVLSKISKSAFDWGVALGEGINNGLSKIPWDSIQSKVNSVVQKVAEFLNGAVEGLDWRLLGNTFGEGFNTVLYGLNTFWKTFDWKNLGVGLGDGINGMFESVDWSTLGEFLARKMSAPFQVVSNMFKTMDWSNMGESIITGINKFIDTMDFKSIADSIEYGLNGAIDFLWSGFKGFDAKNASEKIGGFVNNIADAIGNIDWKQFGNTLSTGVTQVVDFLSGAIKKVNWTKFVFNIIDAIVDIFIGIDWLKTLGSLISGIWNVGVALVEGLIGGIGGALVGIGKILKSIFVDPVVNKVKELFGVASPSKVFAEIGTFLIEGLWSGISSAKDWMLKKWEEVKGWFSNITKTAKVSIPQKWKDIQKSWTDLTSNIKDKTASMKAKIGTTWSSIKKNWTNITSNIKNKTASMKAKIGTTWSSLRNSWSNITSNIKDKTASMKAKIGTSWSNLRNSWNSLMSNFKDKTITIRAKIGEVVGSFKSTINEQLIKPINKKLPSMFPKIPYLAQGGWVSANNPRLAVIGDNKHEGEIVSPESKIYEQTAKAIKDNGGAEKQVIDLVVKLQYPDGKYLIKEINDAQIRDGRISLLV